MIRKAIIVVFLAGSSLIVWFLYPFHAPSFLLTLVLLISCADLLTRRPVQRHLPVRVGLVVGIIVGIAGAHIALLAPLPVSPTTKFFLWPSLPGVALLFVIQGTGSVHYPGTPILMANVVMYSISALVIAGLVAVVRRLVTTVRNRKPGAGYCPICKYNLTGNVSGTCPECGAAVE